MGYYGGEVIPGRCEDFPCCGHYDNEGEFCPQPSDVPGTLEYALRKAENEWHEAERKRKEREEYERAPGSCEEYAEANPEASIDYRIRTYGRTGLRAMIDEAIEALPNGEASFTQAKAIVDLIPGVYIEAYCGHCKECIAEAYDNERAGMEREEDYR